MQEKVNILLIGTGLSGNMGSQAMIQAAVKYLNETHISEITLFTFNPEIDNALAQKLRLNISINSIKFQSWFFRSAISLFFNLIGLKSFSMFLIKDLIKLYNVDYILEVTGISFNDHQGVATSIKHLLWLVPSLTVNRMEKYIKVSQATGPFNHFMNRMIAIYAYNKIEHFRARGKKSLENLTSLSDKFKNKDFIYAADLSFLLEPCSRDEALEILDQEDIKLEPGKKYFGFTPNMIQIDRLGKNKIKELYSECAKTIDYINNFYNFEVLLIPHSFRRSEKSKSIEKKLLGFSKLILDDSIFIKEVYNRLQNKDKAHLVLNEKYAYQIKGVFKLMDLNIVMRFHSMIGSLGAGVSCFVISWSHKYTEVMKEFGLEKFVVDGNDFSLSLYKELIDEFLTKNSEFNDIVKEKLMSVKKMTKENFNIINFKRKTIDLP